MAENSQGVPEMQGEMGALHQAPRLLSAALKDASDAGTRVHTRAYTHTQKPAFRASLKLLVACFM